MEATMNKVIEVTVDIDAFVVPNRASKIDPSTLEYSFGQNLLNYMKEISDLNNVDFNYEEDKLLQLWFVGTDTVDSDNLQDHGFSINYDGREYNFRAGAIKDYLPAKMFRECKEGDVISVTYHIKPSYSYDLPMDEIYMIKSREERLQHMIGYEKGYKDSNPELAPDFLITFNIKLNQQSYRYARFGNFEDAYLYACH